MYSSGQRIAMAVFSLVLIAGYYASTAVFGESLILKGFFGTMLLATSLIASKKQLGM